MRINIETSHPKDIKITINFPIGDVREACIERQPDNKWIYNEFNYKTVLSKTNWVDVMAEGITLLLLNHSLGR
jgi:hypothetical protein